MRAPGCFRCLRAGFGAHDISFVGGLCLIGNTILGSGMVQIPGLFQSAGWLVPCLAFALCAALSGAASLFLSRAVTAIPGNADLSQRVEYALLLRERLAPAARWAALAALILSFITQNISNVVVSAQVADDMLIVLLGRTCGIVFVDTAGDGGGAGWRCILSDATPSVIEDSPFGSGLYVLSAGYLITAALTVPLSYLSLDSNVAFQVGGLAIIVICQAIWCAQFAVLGLSAAALPALAPAGASWGSSYAQVLPCVLYNYGFVAAIPSWLNEKGGSVSTTRTVITALALTTALYIILGLFGAASPLAFASGVDFLSLIANGGGSIWVASKVAVFIFPAANLMTSIPIFSLLVRYNLVNAAVAPAWLANVIAIGAPWLASLYFYAGNGLAELINWSAALLFAAVNLAVPLAIYLSTRAAGARRRRGSAGAAGGALGALSAALRDEEGEAGMATPGGGGSRAGSADFEQAGKGGGYRPPPDTGGGDAASVASINLAWGDELGSDARMLGGGGGGGGGGEAPRGDAAPLLAEDIRPTPRCFRERVLSDARLAALLLAVSAAVAVAAIALQAVQEYEADT